jgi:hypothetical protein
MAYALRFTPWLVSLLFALLLVLSGLLGSAQPHPQNITPDLSKLRAQNASDSAADGLLA